MAEQQTPAQRLLGDFAPKMVQLTDDVLFGDVWERPGLSPATAAWLLSPSWPQPTGPTSSSATCAVPWPTVLPRTNSSRPSPTWPSTPAGRPAWQP